MNKKMNENTGKNMDTDTDKEKKLNMKTGTLKLLPYGLSNYERLLAKNCYYIDKTMYLPLLEKAGDYLFFIRPRRFGKSLFLSIMEAYYDVYYKDRFDEFFQDTFIHENPTPEKNAYLVLKFDFSQVDPKPDKVENSFLRYVRGQVESFLKKYQVYLEIEGETLSQEIKEIDSASDILSELSRLCRENHAKTYILIDEYDNFANTILSSTGENAYHNLTHGEGFFRAFFNILKGGTSGMEAPFTRLFLTGVSPITMDDVTSGYNIGENISLDAAFNRMLGFSEADVLDMLHYYYSQGQLPADSSEILAIIKEWYGNYLFSQYESEQERIFNPDMVLYFLKEYFKNQSVPKNLIDDNVKVDYNKLRHLILVDKDNTKKTNGNFSRIKEIIEKGETFAQLVKAFPLSKLTNPDSFISLLFYFGLLTIDDAEQEPLKLTIPNETIRHLFYGYIVEGYEETGVFSLDISTYNNLISNMAKTGKWEPLFRFITERMKESLSLRDLIRGEKAIQAFLNVYLGLSNRYILHTEKELNKGYADIVMEPFLARYKDIQYSYIIEIKYMKPGEAKKKPADQEIQKLVVDAENQLRQYSLDEKLAKSLAPTTLVKIVLVFCGHEAVYIASL